MLLLPEIVNSLTSIHRLKHSHRNELIKFKWIYKKLKANINGWMNDQAVAIILEHRKTYTTV